MGSTSRSGKQVPRQKDHPHIHGEHLAFKYAGCHFEGSPPYTWGARQSNDPLRDRRGITPIYMGSTFAMAIMKARGRDHPHIHGEHYFESPESHQAWGSPPYTWGARVNLRIELVNFGITPIYMGSTQPNHRWPNRDQDHPHIHGEHSKRSL